MAVSKRLRYEVLRRDNHACRYCGASAPEAKLTVDHVIPVTLGGTDDPTNLVAACTDCNGGKSAVNPDASLVADVSEDAFRWGSAISRAAEVLLREHEGRAELHQQFLSVWNEWTWGPPHKRQHIPLETGWEGSVDRFLAAGLPMEVLLECLQIAMSASRVSPDSTFRYMCGIAWRKVSELQEIAFDLLKAEDCEGDGMT